MVSTLMRKFRVASELGLEQVAHNAAYKIGLRFGAYRRSISEPYNPPGQMADPLRSSPNRDVLLAILGEAGIAHLLERAEHVLGSEHQLFGIDWVPINLVPPSESVGAHWVDLETGSARLQNIQDIKLAWEPARFSWAPILGIANFLQPDPNYLRMFLSLLDQFRTANPAGMGPNWQSAQEVALRAINVTFTAHFFGDGLSKDHKHVLGNLLAEHANRIMQTLSYARSQNNNHYLSESVALVTIAKALPWHKKANKWYKTGWQGVDWCLRTQIDNAGEYVQHSTNYHRLLLQLALWLYSVDKDAFHPNHFQQLAKAATWYACRVDSGSGQAPNLGANDGALIFPLSNSAFSDHRPTAQASLQLFSGQRFQSGPWDDLLLWFGYQSDPSLPLFEGTPPGHLANQNMAATIRTIRYTNRPSHADHLHMDVWANGYPLALDAGTYSYNSPPPWQNPLTASRVHNTVTINSQDQMVRVSKFLYSQWGESSLAQSDPQVVTAIASINGPEKYTHCRIFQFEPDGSLLIQDEIDLVSDLAKSVFEIHWLLAGTDWQPNAEDGVVLVGFVNGARYQVTVSSSIQLHQFRVTQGGKNIAGDLPCQPSDGWYSPTYLVKETATSMAAQFTGCKKCSIQTRITQVK